MPARFVRRSPVRRFEASTRQLDVTVVLGDPRLPDRVKRDGKFNPEDIETVDHLKVALSQLPAYRFRYLDDHSTLERDLSRLRTDLVLNLCDEGFDNDPFKELHIPAFLEARGLPYTGAGPSALASCYDKGLVRALALSLDIPAPEEALVGADATGVEPPCPFPLFLKPNFGDGSEGIGRDSIVNDRHMLAYGLAELRARFPQRPILVQEYLPGREYSVGLVGNPGRRLHALPILEMDFSQLAAGLPKIQTYEAKWDPQSPYWKQLRYRRAELPSHQHKQLIEHSVRLFERLGCRDYARLDFRADAEGEIKLLDVNPNPGWCWDGKLNIMAGFVGLAYSDLLNEILAAAIDRLGIAQPTLGRRGGTLQLAG